MISIIIHCILTAAFLLYATASFAWDQGIYLTQYTLEQTPRLQYLIKRSKAVGINTFVIDIEKIGKKYDENIAIIKANHINYVARVVVFPDGGTVNIVRDPAYWEKRYRLVNHAIELGADRIQLDYIRYNTHRDTSPRYTKDIYRVVNWFKERVSSHHVPLEIDVFGETCFIPSRHIGQDLTVLANTVDGVNPMVYPSHYWPYQKHSAHPYETIADSLDALSDQFDDHLSFKVHAFIEASNYHYVMSPAVAQAYIYKELQAVKDSNITSGWYAWSAHNQYDNLFQVLSKNNKPVHQVNWVKAEATKTTSSILYGLIPLKKE